MAIPELSITWSVGNMEVDATEENTVLSVNYNLATSYSDETQTESSYSSFTVQFDADNIDSSDPDFIDYNNLTESDVLGWLDGYQFPHDTETYKEKVENRLRYQHNLRFSRVTKSNPWS